MSLFFDSHFALSPGEETISSAWSNNDFNMILAIATNKPRIIFVNEEGKMLPNFEIQRGKILPVCLKWHPVFQSLAIGWSDGCVTLWNEDQRQTREDKLLHKAPLSIITFSTDGSRMVTGDQKGTVGVWRTHRGLTQVCSYKKEGAVNQIVFCSLIMNQDRQENNTNSLFFFGGQSGAVCLADDLKNCSEVCKVPGSVKSILFYEKENSVIIITSHLLLVQFKLNLSEKLVPDRKVKLAVSGNIDYLTTIWTGQGLLATVSGENMVRMFNIENDENYVLTLAEPSFKGQVFQDKIVSIEYNPRRRIISCGTKEGYIVMWKCKQFTTESPVDSDGWEGMPCMRAHGKPITQLYWSGNMQILAGVHSTGCVILNHTVLKKKMKDNFKMIQISNKAVEVRMRNDQSQNQDFQIIMSLGMNIKGIDCCGNQILFYNGKFAQVYEVSQQNGPQLLGNFESHSNVSALTQNSVVQSMDNKIEVCSYKGEVMHVLQMSENEGEVIHIDARGRFMAVITSNNMIKIFDISKKEYKQLGVTRKFEMKVGVPLGEIKDITLNADGKKLCILADQQPFPSIRIPDTKFYIYDIDMDNFMEYQVANNRVPLEAFWDQNDKRLLAVETEYIKDLGSKGTTLDQTVGEGQLKPGLENIKLEEIDRDFKNKKQEEEFQNKTIETYFVTSDFKIQKQSHLNFEEGDETMLGVQVPFFYFMGRKIEDEDEEIEDTDDKGSSSMIILRKPMKDFVGLENVQDDIKAAIMNFSFYLTVGNMDEAYNSVRNIKNNTVWQNMAQMCVKTKRLDVAQVCLGNMRFARGAKAAREAEKEKEPEARIAMVAIQLNMIDDAKELYRSCGRYDLLCKLHQACGEWDEAIEVAEKYNRINLKNTHYALAKHFESIGETDNAIRHFVQSNTHRIEVPRMLCGLRDFDRLQAFVQGQREPELFKWWAQYLEAQGMLQESLGFYREAHEWGSVVRLLCMCSDVSNAVKIALETGDPQGAFHLARHYEQNQNIREAIVYYSKSQRLHHAIRMAMEHGFDQEVMTLSLQASKQNMIMSANYFENKGKHDKAVQLFSRGGNRKRAMDLAIRHNLTDMIENISTGVSEGDDPEVLKKSVDFLLGNRQFDKAVEIMISLGDTHQALAIAEAENVKLKEDMAMKLIPEASQDPLKKKQRIDVLMRVAKIVKKQGDFKMGAKLYTMANEKIKGIKCLLKSGEVKAVISFAQTARQTEVYILAGNFLQNQNWHNDPEIMKTIISFYQKAKSFESLANFYDACAQVEIDEYRDYEKALGAMKEAMRQLEKSNADGKEVKLTMMRKRVGIIEKFVQAREALNNNDSNTAMSICDSLVDTHGVEEAIRLGDVFAQLIEHYFYKQQYQDAYKYLEKMKKKSIIVTPYLDPQIVEDIYKGVGIAMPQSKQDDDDGIEEDIQAEF